MRITVLSPEIPLPVHKGNQARINEVIRELARTHLVSLCIGATPASGARAAEVAGMLSAAYGGNVRVRVCIPRKPDTVSRFVNRRLARLRAMLGFPIRHPPLRDPGKNFRALVKDEIARFHPEAIWVNYARLLRAVPHGWAGQVIVDQHDIQADLAQSSIDLGLSDRGLDIDRLLSQEMKLLATTDTIVAINSREAGRTAELLPHPCRIVTLPVFFPEPALTYPVGEDEGMVLFVGSGSPFNADGVAWLLDHCWTGIREHVPEARLLVVGDVSSSKRLQPHLTRRPGVICMGRVADLAEVYARASVVVCPVRGGAGMKVKVIEAMSHGKAVVATTHAMDGISARSGTHVLIADDPNAFTRAVAMLLADATWRRALGEGGRRLFRAEHSSFSARARIMEILDGTAHRLASPPIPIR